MIEMRWLVLKDPMEFHRHPGAIADAMQNGTRFRVLQSRVDESQGLGTSWTEWKDVPLVADV